MPSDIFLSGKSYAIESDRAPVDLILAVSLEYCTRGRRSRRRSRRQGQSKHQGFATTDRDAILGYDFRKFND